MPSREPHLFIMEKFLNWQTEHTNISQIKSLLDAGYEIEIDSPDGWVGVNFFIDKGMWQEYVLVIDEKEIVKCNQDHLFETTVGWASAEQLERIDGAHVLTEDGTFKFAKVYKNDTMIPIVDINVNHDNHRYYTNGISSHNTGVGKSLFMCHMAANNLTQGQNVLYITLEMSEEKIAERIDANLMDTPLNELKEMSLEAYEKKIDRIKRKTTGKLIVKEYPTASAGSANFRYLLQELKLKKSFVPDVIYVDYLNICSSSRIKAGANVNSYTYVKSIAEELRGLAVEFNVPLISATQTTRSGFSNSDVGLEDTSESFGLPATADFMIAAITSEELQALDQIMVKQLKNRYGDPNYYKKFVVGINRAKMKLYDVEESAQEDIVDDRPVMDKSDYGHRYEEESKPKPKFNKSGFKDFK